MVIILYLDEVVVSFWGSQLSDKISATLLMQEQN